MNQHAAISLEISDMDILKQAESEAKFDEKLIGLSHSQQLDQQVQIISNLTDFLC